MEVYCVQVLQHTKSQQLQNITLLHTARLVSFWSQKGDATTTFLAKTSTVASRQQLHTTQIRQNLVTCKLHHCICRS